MKTFVDVEKSIKSFLKRSKTYTYSTALVVAFLITGHLAYSQEEIIITEEIVETVPTRQELNSEINSEKDKVEELIRKNENSINRIDIQVAQLLEQGEQVIKPWDRSWQVGINYLWSKTHRDRKVRPTIYREKLANPLERFVALSAGTGPGGRPSTTMGTMGKYGYDMEWMDSVVEPQSEMSLVVGISAKAAPENINISPMEMPEHTMSVKFSPTFVKAPVPPKIEMPVPPTVESPTLSGGGANPDGWAYATWMGNDGVFSQVSVERDDSSKPKGIIDLYGKKSEAYAKPRNIKANANIAISLNFQDYNGKQSVHTPIDDASGTSSRTLDKPNGYTGTFANADYDDNTEEKIAQYKIGESYSGNGPFFMTVLNVPYSEIGKDVEINCKIDGFTMIDLETEGDVKVKDGGAVVTGTLERYKSLGYIDDDMYQRFTSYQTYSEIKGDTTEGEALVFENKGTVNLEGSNSAYYYTTSHSRGNFRTNFIDNIGKITAKGQKSIIIKHTPDTSTAKAWIYSNKGEMYADGEKAIIAGWAYGNLSSGDAAFVNDGIAQVRGKNAVGIFFSSNSELKDKNLVYLKNPIDLLGDKSIGLVNLNKGNGTKNPKHLVNFTIGKYTPQDFGQITGDGYDNTKVDEAIGILQDSEAELKTTAIINIGKNSNKGIGIMVKDGSVTVLNATPDNQYKSSITIEDGTENKAIVATPNTTVDFDGEIKVTGGTDTKLIMAQDGATVNLKQNVIIGNDSNKIKDIIIMFASGQNGKIEIANPDNFKAFTEGNSTIGYANNEAIINLNRTTLDTAPNILLNDPSGSGVPFIALNGGKINAQKHNIKIEQGGNAAYSSGVNSLIDLTGSKVDYNGDGYALYATDGAKINFEDGELILRGNSTAMQLDLDTSVAVKPEVIFNDNSKITVMSDDVTVLNIVNAYGTALNVDALDLQNLIGHSIAIEAGTDGSTTFNNYNVAALDGGKIIVNVPLDKSADNIVTKSYFQDFLGQRIQLEVDNNVTAMMSTAQTAPYKGQVVGLEGNASGNAHGVNDTQINIKPGIKVTVGRTDAGEGGTGLFINYGTVNNDGEILVEKHPNPNRNGIGVYAVNSSVVNNKGTIDIDGEIAAGVYALSYRLDESNNKVIDEFGSAPDQGQVHVNNEGTIKTSGNKAIGIYGENNKDNLLANQEIINKGIIEINGDNSVGMVGKGYISVVNEKDIKLNGKQGIAMSGSDGAVLENKTTINLPDSSDYSHSNIGIAKSDSATQIKNAGEINIGEYDIGLYTKGNTTVDNGKLIIPGKGIGIFSENEDLTLVPNLKIEANAFESIGVFTAGNNSKITTSADIKIGEDGFGFVFNNHNSANNAKVEFKSTAPATLNKDSIYIYTMADKAEIDLNNLKATGTGNYGVYANKGDTIVKGTIDFKDSIGNIALYNGNNTVGQSGTLTNLSTINVSGTDHKKKLFGIGMAAGADNPKDHSKNQFGTVINKGTINLENEGSIGMYAIGQGSKAINDTDGTINLSANDTIGIYVANGAVAENHGTITTTADTLTGSIGIFTAAGSYIKNYGTIEVVGDNNSGIFFASEDAKNDSTLSTQPNSTAGKDYKGAEAIKVKAANDTSKSLGGIVLTSLPEKDEIKVTVDGKVVTPVKINTSTPTEDPATIDVGKVQIKLTDSIFKDHISLAEVSTIGKDANGKDKIAMYIDTSGINYTNPIKGLGNIPGEKTLQLLLGNEAAQYTSSKTIEIEDNILKPYNEAIEELNSTGGDITLFMSAASLTWMGTANETVEGDNISKLVLQKIPYRLFAKKKDGSYDMNRYEELEGIDQRYGVEGVGTREKELFNKLNGIGKGEPLLFEQAVNEMKGNQYSNTLRRINESRITFAREFDDLMQWQTETKDTMKVKAFGETNKYRAGKLDVTDYTRDVQGVMILNNNETVRLGQSQGLFAGIANEQFKFKDIGGSKEKAITGEIGYYRSNAYGYNNEVNWTWKAGLEGSYRRMDRRYLVVDDIFHAKSKYHSYGVFLDNTVGRNYRVTEKLTVEPYVGLDLAAGRVGKIHENKGEIRLDIKSKNYYSVVPNAGVKAKYDIPLSTNKIVTSVDLNVSKELGNMDDGKMKARVNRTEAGYYSLVKDKKDKANVGVVGRIGLESDSYGVALKAGYSSDNKGVNGGLEFRVKF